MLDPDRLSDTHIHLCRSSPVVLVRREVALAENSTPHGTIYQIELRGRRRGDTRYRFQSMGRIMVSRMRKADSRLNCA